jgi:RNA:NAD 2'-phosphotransferase (TPT1/KptA family)
MAGKLTRTGYEELIKKDIEWLQKQPRTLERSHIIAIVIDSVKAYYEPAGDCPNAPMPGKGHKIDEDNKCLYCETPDD